MADPAGLNPGQVLAGALVNEPMWVETVRLQGPDAGVVGLVVTARGQSRRRETTPGERS